MVILNSLKELEKASAQNSLVKLTCRIDNTKFKKA
jgi:hypothetical protein